MNLNKLVLIQSAVWGFMGSMFFCWGIIFQPAEEASKVAGTYYGGNPHLLESLVSQKVDFIIGTILIALAFLSQLIAIVLEKVLTENELPKQKAVGTIVYIFAISLIVALICR
jgi:hypothetical protein